DDTANAVLTRETDAVVNGFERDFELENHAVDGLEQVGCGIQVRRLEQIVRAFDHENAVLAVGFNKNRGHTTGDSFNLLDVSGIDPKLLEVLNRRRTEQVATHPGDHEDVSTAQSRSHGLIRALASKAEIELLAKNCFPGLRETITEGGQVNVCASNHRDARTLGHKIYRTLLRKAESSQRSRFLSMDFRKAWISEGSQHRDTQKNSPVCSYCL